MEEVKFEEVKEGQHYIIEIEGNEREIKLNLELQPLNFVCRRDISNYGDIIKILKIELPIMSYQSIGGRQGYSTFKGVKFYKPSKAFIKSLSMRNCDGF